MLKANRSPPKAEVSEWIEKLESLSALTSGWNRHGAQPPSTQAIQYAREFIKSMIGDRQPPTRVAASAVGGVGVTRQVGERIAYFEFYNNGKASALLADDTADERVLDIAPEAGQFKGLLNEVRAFLDG